MAGLVSEERELDIEMETGRWFLGGFLEEKLLLNFGQ